MRQLKITLTLAAALSLAGCTVNDTGAHFTGMNAGDPGSYCYEHTAVCVIGGVVVAGVAAGIIANTSQHSSNTAAPPPPSDSRLKQDIHPLMTLASGLKLYTYHYVGDTRLFSGVLAQDLLQDARFSGAVSRGADGYYRVDYGALGLTLFNGDVMRRAGERAVRLRP
jgi:hypothetical protein